MRQTIQYFTAAILLLVVAFHALTPDAQAISPQEDGSSMRHLSMVLLGDSYSAGNGAGGYDFWHSEFRTKKRLIIPQRRELGESLPETPAPGRDFGTFNKPCPLRLQN